MAENITPAQVPEVQPSELQDILGFDQSNNWAKIKGSAITDAAAAAAAAQAAAESVVSAADSAVTTANAAKTTADGIAGTASQALEVAASANARAQTAETSATKNNALLMDAASWSYESADVVIYAGNFINGVLDPKPLTPEVNVKCRALRISYRAQEHTLTLRGLPIFLGAGLKGELLVLVLGTSKVTIPNAGVVRYTGEGEMGALAFRISVIDYGCTLECMSNCSFELTDTTYFLPGLNAGAVDLTEVNAAVAQAQSTADNAQTAANSAGDSLNNIARTLTVVTAAGYLLQVNSTFVEGGSPHCIAFTNSSSPVTLQLTCGTLGNKRCTVRCVAYTSLTVSIAGTRAGAFTPKVEGRYYMFDLYFAMLGFRGVVMFIKCIANCTYAGEYDADAAALALDDTPSQVKGSDEGYISPEFIEAAMAAYNESEAGKEGGDA